MGEEQGTDKKATGVKPGKAKTWHDIPLVGAGWGWQLQFHYHGLRVRCHGMHRALERSLAGTKGGKVVG